MNSQGSMDVLKGYAIFLLCLFIFTMWGINLFSLSQVEVQSFEEDPKKIEMVEVGTISTYNFKPKPFLYFYFNELGYYVRMQPKVPVDNNIPLLLIDPPEKIDVALMRQVYAWIRKGGNLIVFSPRQHALDKISGVGRQNNESETAEDLYTQLPYLYGVEQISSVKTAVSRLSDASHFAVFAERGSSSNVFYSYKGQGRIVLISHPAMTNGRGLKLADNLVFITRLVEQIAPMKQIDILDTEPSLQIRARAKRLIKRTGTSLVKKKVDHYSFWSLLKANPISWVLAQMAIALVVYFYSSGRRFGRARPAIDPESAALSYIRNVGHLLEENADAAFALEGIMDDFIFAAARRYGLDADELKLGDVIREIEATDPEVARSLKLIEKDAFLIAAGRNQTSGSLLRVVRTLENARKVLKLHD
ncbi:MAG: hypothetical protein AB1403_24005 [Candidatus Riflebacteria bacterium]